MLQPASAIGAPPARAAERPPAKWGLGGPLPLARNGRLSGMPLVHVDSSTYENAKGVHFPMLHGNSTVRVVITRAAIQGGGRPPADGRYLAHFEVAREFFEIVASEKFDSGRPTAKITIDRVDLLGKATEGRKLQIQLARRAVIRWPEAGGGDGVQAHGICQSAGVRCSVPLPF